MSDERDYTLRLTGLLRRELAQVAEDLGVDMAEAARTLLHEAIGRHRARMRCSPASGGMLPSISGANRLADRDAPQHLPRCSPASQPAVIRTSGDKTEGQPLRGAVASTWTEEGPTWDGEIRDAIAEKRARRRPSSGPIKDEPAWRSHVEADLRAGPPGKVRELARAWHHRQEKDLAKAEAAKAELAKRAELDQVEREELARRAEQLRQGRGATRTETVAGSTQRGTNGVRVGSGRAKRQEPG